MITWLSIQTFQSLFGAKVTGYMLQYLQAFGFIELFIELCLVVIVIGVVFYTFVESKAGRS